MSTWKFQKRKNESVAAMTGQKSLIEDLQELVRTSSKENEKLRGQMETLQRQLKTKQEDIDYYLRALAQAKKKLHKETLENRKLKAQLSATASVSPQPLSHWTAR
jgi:predicted RNase H-like nuclease (RuvC/YqgF family)